MDRISKKDYKGKRVLVKSRKSVFIFYVLALILLVLLVIATTYIYKAKGNLSDAAINMMADVVGDDNPISLLVLGVSDDLDSELTDTMMLVSCNPKSQKAFVVSIPRDTYVGKNESSANGYDKINALYQTDVKKTVSAVEKLTGINIDNYIVVKNQALIDVVDAIGGVEFNVPINMKYDDKTQDLHIDLKAGVQVLDGDKAEQMLRFRHSNPDANGKMTTYPAEYGADDYGRMRTQREFIQATIHQLADWKNITKLTNIASAVFDNLETDMKLSKLIGYIPTALKVDTETLRMEQLPGVSDQINNLWFYKANSLETCKLMNELVLSLDLSEKELADMYEPIKKNVPLVAKNNEVDANTITKSNEVNTNSITDTKVAKKDNENKNTTKQK